MKKFLAILLAITMIATFIPSAFAVETGGEETSAYDVEVKCDIESLTVSLGMIGASGKPLSTLNYEKTNGVFRYIRSSLTDDSTVALDTVSDADTYTAEKLLYAGGTPEVGHITLYGGQWIAFEVVVPTRGIYTLDVKRRVATGGGNVSVYITDDDTYYSQSSFSLDNFGVAVGSYSCYKADGSYSDVNSINTKEWDTTSVFENKLLEAGKYVIVYKATSKAAVKAGISSFTFKGTSITDADIGFSIKYDIQSVMKAEGLHTGTEEEYPIENVDYNTTNGFFDVTDSNGVVKYASSAKTAYNFIKPGNGAQVTMKINVPQEGVYSFKTSYQQAKDGTNVKVYIDGAESEVASYSCYSSEGPDNMTAGSKSDGFWVNDAIIAKNIPLTAGEHTIRFATDSNGVGSVGTFELFTGLLGTFTTDMDGFVKVDKTTLAIDDTTNILGAVVCSSDATVKAQSDESTTYKSSDESVVTVSGSEIMAVGTGTADITTTVGGVTAKRTITVVDKAATDEVSTVQFMATSTIANNLGVTTDVDDYTVGGTTSDIAPGTTVEVTANPVTGYIFRGWKRGSKDNGVWVSTNSTYSFPLLTNTYLTAIYDVDTATDADVNVEFYNYNGQFLASKAVGGAQFGTLASDVEPTLTGYNNFFWTIDGDTAVAADRVFEKLTRVVAKFTDTDSFAVTVPTNVTSNKDSGTYAYDTEITMTANNAGLWKVNGEPVAYGETYTYTVWSKAEIAFEVKENDNKPIISIDDNATDGARMISYDANGANIVEAGILFGSGATINAAQSRAVSREAKGDVSGQFTAKPYDSNDVNAARGYLIYSDGNTYRVIYAD